MWRNFTNEDIHVNQNSTQTWVYRRSFVRTAFNTQMSTMVLCLLRGYLLSVVGHGSNGDTSQYSGYKIAPVINAYGIYNLILTAHIQTTVLIILKIDDFMVYIQPKTRVQLGKVILANTIRCNLPTPVLLNQSLTFEWKIENQTFSDINLEIWFSQTAGTKTVTYHHIRCWLQSERIYKLWKYCLTIKSWQAWYFDHVRATVPHYTSSIDSQRNWRNINGLLKSIQCVQLYDGAKVFPRILPDIMPYFCNKNGCVPGFYIGNGCSRTCAGHSLLWYHTVQGTKKQH